MNQAIAIIQADMRAFFAAGFSIKDYTKDHVISALHCADFEMSTLPVVVSPQGLLLSALIDNCKKALEQ
jgi:hypothetical protein